MGKDCDFTDFRGKTTQLKEKRIPSLSLYYNWAQLISFGVIFWILPWSLFLLSGFASKHVFFFPHKTRHRQTGTAWHHPAEYTCLCYQGEKKTHTLENRWVLLLTGSDTPNCSVCVSAWEHVYGPWRYSPDDATLFWIKCLYSSIMFLL